MDNRHTLDQRHVTADDALRIYGAWMRFGWDMIGLPLDSARAAGERMTESAARGLFGAWAPKAFAQEIAQEYANLALGLLAVPSSSVGSAVAQFDAPRRKMPDPIEKALSGSAPAPTGQSYDLRRSEAAEQVEYLADRAGDGVRDTNLDDLATRVADRFLLPARVLDASQALASWFVPVAKARRLMEEAVVLGHQPEEVIEAFEPVVVGGAEAMVSLLVTDYRASDFGVLKEIGLTLSVTPRGTGFADPGQMFIRLIVTDPYSLVAARRIWGIRKDLWDTYCITPRSPIDASYSESRIRFGVETFRPETVRRPDMFAIDFPRFGAARSQSVPTMIYSMVDADDQAPGASVPARSILRRSGSGEGMQFGGPVKLSLPESRAKGQDGGCLCSNGMACLCATLRDLGLNNTPPALNSWTERMTSDLEAPAPIK